jgi:hypothetical protein
MPTLGSNVTGAIAATAQYVPEQWTKEIEKPFYKALQLAKVVRRRDAEVPNGDTLNIPFLGTVNARAKAGGTAVTYDSPEGTPITLLVNKQYYSAILIEDFAKVQASYELANEFRGAQAEAVARQIDTDLAGEYANVTTTTAGGAVVDDADVLATVYALDAADVPRDDRFGVIGAGAMNDLLNVNKYVAYDQTGAKGVAVNDGMVADVYGFKILLSNNVVFSTTGKELFFQKKAISLGLQLKPTYKMEDSVDFIGMKTVLHSIYGVKTERPGAGAVITRATAV